MDLNDPSRVATINYVLSKSAPMLRVGDQVRLGMEGDPCSVYKGSNAASTGIVTHLEQNKDGSIEFTAGFSDGAVMRLNSYDVRPERVWERLGKFGASARESEEPKMEADEPTTAMSSFSPAAPLSVVQLGDEEKTDEEKTDEEKKGEEKVGNDEEVAKPAAYKELECELREKMCKLEEIVGTLCDRVSETEASCRTTLIGLNHHAEVQKVLLGHIAHALVLAAQGVESPTMRKILEVFDQLYAYTDECRGVPSLEEASQKVEQTHRGADDDDDENDVRKFGGRTVSAPKFTNKKP